MINDAPQKNPFVALRFYEFAAVSALVLAFFPVSFVVCWLAFGTVTTRDLVQTMIKDWMQTMLILTSLLILVFGSAVWGIIEWLF
jgi:succinate dehydrogenase hydrophobic anchor subunit